MINYTKNVWADNDASKPVSAARLTTMENGIFDAHWRDAARVFQSGNVTIQSNAWFDLTFNGERYDQGNMFNVSVPHKLSVQTSGIYALGANASFLTRVSGWRGMRFLYGTASSTIVIAETIAQAVLDTGTVLNLQTNHAATAGTDYFVVQVRQSSPAVLGLETPSGANYAKEFWALHVSAF